jgi:penicillin-binding protein 1A
MTPTLQRAAAFTTEQFHRLLEAARRHPVWAALLLPLW